MARKLMYKTGVPSRRQVENRRKEFWGQVETAVAPWPEIVDLEVSQTVTRRSPRGETIRGLLKLLGVLLLGFAGYGMIKADRELLFGILDLVKYVLGLLALWALGNLAAHLRPRGIPNHEKNEDSG